MIKDRFHKNTQGSDGMGKFDDFDFVMLYIITYVTLVTLATFAIRILYAHQGLILLVGLFVAYSITKRLNSKHKHNSQPNNKRKKEIKVLESLEGLFSSGASESAFSDVYTYRWALIHPYLYTVIRVMPSAIWAIILVGAGKILSSLVFGRRK